MTCRNPSFGLATKARGCKVVGVKRKEARELKGRKPGSKGKGIGRVRAKRKPGSHHILPGVWGSEHSHSQGNSHFGRGSRWSPETSECQLKGQISMDCCALGTVGKPLKLKCLKWARIAHLDIWKASYGQKKGRESNWQFDSRPLKVGNQPLPDIRFERATWRWKALDEGYNFASDRVAIGLWSREISASKVPGLQPGAISGLPRGSPGKNSHLDATSVESCRVYYKGEGGGFPKSGPWWVLCVRVARGLS